MGLVFCSKQNCVGKPQKHRVITRKIKVNEMGVRFRLMVFFALVGFVAGVIANLTYDWVSVRLLEIFPLLLQAQWLFWGFAGAMLAMIFPIVWAYLTSPE